MVPSVRHFFFFFTLAWRVSRSTARGVGPPGGGGVFSCSPRWGPQLGFDHAGPGLRGLLSGVTNSLFSATALRTLPNFERLALYRNLTGAAGLAARAGLEAYAYATMLLPSSRPSTHARSSFAALAVPRTVPQRIYHSSFVRPCLV